MTQRMERMLKSLRAKEHRAVRRDVEFPPAETLAELSPAQRVTVRLKQVLEAECPVVRPEERIVFQLSLIHIFHLEFTQQALENMIAYTGDPDIEPKLGAYLNYILSLIHISSSG